MVEAVFSSSDPDLLAHARELLLSIVNDISSTDEQRIE